MININKGRLLTPGPTALPERVRLAMSGDMIHHRKTEFKKAFQEVQEGLKELFDTQEPVLPFTSSGTGAMEATAGGLFNPKDEVLIIQGGYFGERWTAICQMHQLHTHVLHIPWGEAVQVHSVQEYIDTFPNVCGIFVQLSETSTGVQHPIKELASLTRQRQILLVVDGISGVSISPCPMDAWGLDALLTGSQKGLMLPPGLSLAAYSARAWEKAQHVQPRNYYFNLLKERERCLQNQTSFTPAISLLLGLRESLAMFRELGLHNIYQKQWAMTQMVRHGIGAMGLELFAKTHYSWGLTSILLPEGIPADALAAYASKKYNVIFATGQGSLKKSILRFGHMGWLDFGDLLAGLFALAESYQALGGAVTCRDYLEQALSAYQNALEAPVPLV